MHSVMTGLCPPVTSALGFLAGEPSAAPPPVALQAVTTNLAPSGSFVVSSRLDVSAPACCEREKKDAMSADKASDPKEGGG